MMNKAIIKKKGNRIISPVKESKISAMRLKNNTTIILQLYLGFQ